MDGTVGALLANLYDEIRIKGDGAAVMQMHNCTAITPFSLHSQAIHSPCNVHIQTTIPPLPTPLKFSNTRSLSYATSTLPLPPSHLIARISRSNTASIALFKKLGFGVVKVVEVWDEVEMRWGWVEGSGEGEGGEDEDDGEERARKTPDMLAWNDDILVGRIGVYDAPSG